MRKQRLGLRPVAVHEWLQLDEALLEHKRSVLRRAYAQAVAEVPEFKPPDVSALSLTMADSYPHWIANLASQIAEDVCVLDVRDRQRLVAGCVTAPSYWSLLDKMGQPLREVHQPVQGLNRKLGASIERFIARMPEGQPFRRDNWFVHGGQALMRTRGETAAELGENPARWFVRSEQQGLYKPDGRHLLFTIRVVQVPLQDIFSYSEARNDLLQTLAAMDADEVEHFGGVAKHALLTDYVARGMQAREEA